MTNNIPLPPESPKKSGKKEVDAVTNEMRKEAFEKCHLPKNIKSKIQFDNPEKYQTKKKLHQEIRQTLLELRKTLPYANHREIIMQFIGVINPGSMGGDVTRLPYESSGPVARTASKMECVFALVSYVIQEYWKYCTDIYSPIYINQNLEFLQQITKNGLNQYQVIGNVREGFSLGGL